MIQRPRIRDHDYLVSRGTHPKGDSSRDMCSPEDGSTCGLARSVRTPHASASAWMSSRPATRSCWNTRFGQMRQRVRRNTRHAAHNMCLHTSLKRSRAPFEKVRPYAAVPRRQCVATWHACSPRFGVAVASAAVSATPTTSVPAGARRSCKGVSMSTVLMCQHQPRARRSRQASAPRGGRLAVPSCAPSRRSRIWRARGRETRAWTGASTERAPVRSRGRA